MYYQPSENKVFESHSDIRAALWASASVIFESVIVDAALAEAGVFPLHSERPIAQAGEIIEPGTVEQVADAWVQQWTVRAATPDEIPVVDETEITAAYMTAVQQHMDAIAVSFGYDNLASVISYADEPIVPRYQVEGRTFRAWRSTCWDRCETVLAEVKAGTREIPTHAELIALLPEAPTK